MEDELDEITHLSSKNVQVENTEWLIPDILPIGHTALLVGEPGVGKSTLCSSLCAQYTRGELDGTPGKTFWMSLEENAAHVIKPRMLAAGAREHRVFYRSEDAGDPQFPKHLPEFARYLDKHRPGLVVIDSAQEFIPRMSVEPVRLTMRRLKEYARDYNTTIIMICHYNRTGNSIQKALYGSSGFYQSARVVLQLGLIPPDFQADPDDRVLTVVKSNLAPIPPPLRFSMTERKVVGVKRMLPAFELEGEMSDGPSSSAVFEYNRPKKGNDDNSSGRNAQRKKAKAFLTLFLANGKVRATEVLAVGVAAGHTEKTIRRAADDLKVEKEQKDNASWWSLPNTTPTPSLPTTP